MTLHACLEHPLAFGEPVPLLHLKTPANPRFALGSLAGRWMLLTLLPKDETARGALLDAVEKASPLFKLEERILTLVTPAAFEAAMTPRIKALQARFVTLFDEEEIAYRAMGIPVEDGAVFVIDPGFRVLAVFRPGDAVQAIQLFARLGTPDTHAGVPLLAPVLTVPRVFEPEFCKTLIDYYQARGGMASGVTRERGGVTLVEQDERSKKRFDCEIDDAALRMAAMKRIFWRLLPELKKAFQFEATRMERYLVACYDAETGGYFNAHRDNTTRGTAHRRFAVSIHLDAGAFTGGGVRFPEYGSRVYSPPTGGALVFSCSMLHEALPIASGKRYAFLPFLYDEAAAELREANAGHLDPSIGSYRRSAPEEGMEGDDGQKAAR